MTTSAMSCWPVPRRPRRPFSDSVSRRPERGIVKPRAATATAVNLSANTNADVIEMDVPSGVYSVTAVAGLVSNGASTMSCGLSANNGGGAASIFWKSTVALAQASQPIQLLTTKAVTRLTLNCSSGTAAGAASGSIIATPVG